MGTMYSLAVVVAVACLSSLVTFGIVYILWLRAILQRLVDVQNLLKKVSHLFAAHDDSSPLSHPAVGTETTATVPKLQMSVEGKAVAILEINGRDVVRFQDELSEDQKKRIIQYLKVEGFITKNRP
jgi:hypothetical protein